METEDLSGDIKGFKKLQKLPDEKEIVKSYVQEANSNPILEKYNQRVYNSTWHGFLMFFFIFVITMALIIAGVFVYLVYDGAFKTSIDQPINNNVDNTAEIKNDFTNNFDNKFTIPLNATVVIQNLYVNSNQTH